ncbi:MULTISPECIES: class I adenylate-forming enzyme family protein [Comamonadaceae]|uniref:class I adenylate-forming enzyme family protein n=1 Tax=Comamonadaceae TaxID=80864 RepID=UPI00271A2145|nr:MULTISPECIES: class I adenylate-forming enzyme family protein [Comamonadaceae]MDO9143482.1 class I adenylate-forming enzyme family protein [Rhodoferax sp.]MDP3884965.1 class I adenylate-forming enzyme family protein [Hydrogenophaga sp.]
MTTHLSHSDLLASAAQCRAQLTGPGAPFELETIAVNGQAMQVYRHASSSLPALINAGRVHADLEFMVYEGDRWSFGRFFAAVDALAGRLQADHGVQKADRVAIAMRNRPEWAVAFAAVALLGAIPVPLNSFGLHDELMDNLRDVQPVLLVCDQVRHERVAADLPAIGCRSIVVDAPSSGTPDWAALISPGGPVMVSPALQADDPALILFTSGASSKAKGVLSTQRAVCQALFNIDYIGAISAMTSPAVIAVMMARRLQPTTLTAVPLFHVSGLHAQLLASLRHGRRLVFMHRWDPATALETIRAERITQFNGAPAMVQQLLAQPGFDDPALTSTLMGIGFGGAGLPQRLIDEVLKRRGDGMNGVGFGMTETNGVGAAAAGSLFKAYPDKSGLLSPIIELRVAEFDGTPLPAGEAGELWLRGVTVMQAYWAQPEATAAVFSDGWLRSGDIGFLDANGFIRVVDRIKDVINRNGEKIAAAEVESCLLQHPGLVEAAVFAQPDDVTGEAVVAVVVTQPGVVLTQAAVRDHVAAHLAAYKVPVRVYLRDEPLPRNPAGKMLKTVLKRELLKT